MSASLTHRSAVVLIPPLEVWGPIQAIRRRHDRKVERWMPHLTLLYPFWPRPKFPDAARLLAGACAALPPFDVTLQALRWFAHGRGRFTLWLAPMPAGPLERLHAALGRALGAEGASRAFVPHLSVGQASSKAERDSVLREVEPQWRAVTFRVHEVALIAREDKGPFEVDRTVGLGVADADHAPCT